MHRKILNIVIKVVPIIISALGGALMVFSGYDDSPGGSLVGFIMILWAFYITLKQATAKP